MTKFPLFLILFFLTNSTKVLAQKGCDCDIYLKAGNNARKIKMAGKIDHVITELLASKSDICIAKGYELKAYNFYKQSNLDSAEIVIEKSLEIQETFNCRDGSSPLDAYKLAVGIYENKANFEKSLTYILKAMTIIEKGTNVLDKVYGYFAVSFTFNRLKDFEMGMQYCKKAEALIGQLPLNSEKVEVQNRIARRYLFYFEKKGEEKYYDTAMYFSAKAIADARLINDTLGKINAWISLSSMMNIKNKNTESILYSDSALKFCKPFIHVHQLAELYNVRAKIFNSKMQYTEAKKYADSSLLYNQLIQDPPSIATAYKLIYEIASKSGNTKDALQALENEKKITDSLTNSNNTKTISELEKKYNQAKNEERIRSLAQDKKLYGLLAIAGLLLVGLVAFSMRQQSLKHKQKILETEQRLNRARMNPHFFFNALASLQNFAMQDNDSITLAENLSKFSHIMRETLENTYREYVTIEQEMTFLEEYLELQTIRFPHKFNYTTTADKNLETDELMIPSMILQPFVENSIEHGFLGIDYRGILTIHFTKETNEIKVNITDNGKGLKYSVKSNDEHISRASQIIKDRIYLLNIKLKTNARFSIGNNENGDGVNVIIHLPVLYKENISVS